MKIVFLSNYFNHHQKFVSEKFDKICSLYRFIATSKMREERRLLGYGEALIPKYVVEYKDDAEREFIDIINNCDAAIWGSAPQKLIRERINEYKVVFKYSERPLKKGDSIIKYIPRFIKWHLQYPISKPIYMLCASAYTAYDYKKYGLFNNRAYKWGYFPETKKYDIQNLLKHKVKTRILWCGRFLDWKHPDDVIKVAKRLKQENYDFELDFIGTGFLEEELKQMVSDAGLHNYVSFLGSMKPERVREHMEQAGIYLFTSDCQEGWGVVLNEAMNSGCAVIASHEIGAAPYLINNNENGLIYKSGDIDMLLEKVKYLLDNQQKQEQLGKAAYETITETWNAEVAAERFINLAQHILDGEKTPDLYENGPCSKAEIIKDNWYYG